MYCQTCIYSTWETKCAFLLQILVSIAHKTILHFKTVTTVYIWYCWTRTIYLMHTYCNSDYGQAMRHNIDSVHSTQYIGRHITTLIQQYWCDTMASIWLGFLRVMVVLWIDRFLEIWCSFSNSFGIIAVC